MDEGFPEGWTKTLEELIAEKRAENGSLSSDDEEFKWAQAYGKAQLKKWAHFPQDGEAYEAIGDVEVSCSVDMYAPFSISRRFVLPKGTRVTVRVPDGEEDPMWFQVEMEDIQKYEEALVPPEQRSSPRYGRFSVTITVAELNNGFRLL